MRTIILCTLTKCLQKDYSWPWWIFVIVMIFVITGLQPRKLVRQLAMEPLLDALWLQRRECAEQGSLPGETFFLLNLRVTICSLPCHHFKLNSFIIMVSIIVVKAFRSRNQGVQEILLWWMRRQPEQLQDSWNMRNFMQEQGDTFCWQNPQGSRWGN